MKLLERLQPANLLQTVQDLAVTKQGRATLIGSAAILMTLLSLGMVSMSGVTTSTPRKNTPSEPSAPPQAAFEPASTQPPDAPDQAQERYGQIGSKFQESENTKQCDNRFPDNGYARVFRTDWASSTVAKSGIQLDNRTDKPIWLRLTHPTAGFPIVGYMIHPFQTVTQRVNVGLYGVDFTTGTQWCNSIQGILQSKTLALANNVPLPKTQSVMIRITADNTGQLDAVVTNLPRLDVGNRDLPTVIEKRK